MRYAALGVMGLVSVWVWARVNAASDVYFRPTRAPVGSRSQRRVTRRMMHAVAIWEGTVAMVLIALEGWGSVPNVIALLGTAAMVCWSPLLIRL